MLLYVDGARLVYALGCQANDASLAYIARIADAFYIGDTKCGALFGEAVVFPIPGTAPRFFTQVKRAGPLLTKGRIAGIQFETLFEDGLYAGLGRWAIATADRIRAALRARGLRLTYPSPTNQIFVELSPDDRARLERIAYIARWEEGAEGRTVMRIAASWAPGKRTWTPCWRSCSRQAGHRRAWQGSRRQGAPPCPSCVPVSCPRARRRGRRRGWESLVAGGRRGAGREERERRPASGSRRCSSSMSSLAASFFWRRSLCVSSRLFQTEERAGAPEEPASASSAGRAPPCLSPAQRVLWSSQSRPLEVAA